MCLVPLRAAASRSRLLIAGEARCNPGSCRRLALRLKVRPAPGASGARSVRSPSASRGLAKRRARGSRADSASTAAGCCGQTATLTPSSQDHGGGDHRSYSGVAETS